MILLIDNYDSFSYNLYQLVGEFEPNIWIIRNDEMTAEEIRALQPWGMRSPFWGSVWGTRPSAPPLAPPLPTPRR